MKTRHAIFGLTFGPEKTAFALKERPGRWGKTQETRESPRQFGTGRALSSKHGHDQQTRDVIRVCGHAKTPLGTKMTARCFFEPWRAHHTSGHDPLDGAPFDAQVGGASVQRLIFEKKAQAGSAPIGDLHVGVLESKDNSKQFVVSEALTAPA